MRSTSLDVRGLSRRNPVRAAGAVAARRARGPVSAAGAERPRCRRGPRRRRLRRRRRPGSPRLRLGLPLVLTEADRHLGLTNRMLARRARRVCLAFPIPGLDGPRVLGHRAADSGRRRARRPRRGSRALRDRRRRPLPARLRRQPGRPLDQPLRGRGVRGRGRGRARFPRPPHQRRARLRRDPRPPRSTPRTPIATRCSRYEPGLADALAASDLVLARSGGSIFEVAAAGRPSILVPYPHASGRHQHANAEWMADGGAAVVVEDAELEPTALRALAGDLLGDPARLAEMAVGRARARPSRRRRAGRGRAARRDRRTFDRHERATGRGRGASLHRHRRRRDERPGAGLRTARRPGDRHRPRRELVPAPGAGRGDRGAPRPRRRRGSGRARTSSSRPRSATTTRSSPGRESAASG